MSCVDSAIIKALVEHVGMDPDGVQLGSPITGEEPITVSEDRKIGIAIDDSTMEIKDGKIAAKASGLAAGDGIIIDEANTISVNHSDDFVISNKALGLATKAKFIPGKRLDVTYSNPGTQFTFSQASPGGLRIGTLLVGTNSSGSLDMYDMITERDGDNYTVIHHNGSTSTLTWDATNKVYRSTSLFMPQVMSEKYGVFQLDAPTSADPVMVTPAGASIAIIEMIHNLEQYIETKWNEVANLQNQVNTLLNRMNGYHPGG